MKIYAHRGYSGRYLENTMEAFIAADLIGADGIELDVRLSRDGQVVIFHDPTLRRVGAWYGSVNRKSLNTLRRIPMVYNQRNYFIPTLDDFLFWFAQTDIVVNIELKTEVSYDLGLEKKVLDWLQHYEVEDRVFFSSFNQASIKRMKQLAPAIPAGLLVKKATKRTIQRAKEFKLEYYHPSYRYLTKDLVDFAHAQNLKVNTWTVNQAEAMEKMKVIGVDGVITNYPNIALEMK